MCRRSGLPTPTHTARVALRTVPAASQQVVLFVQVSHALFTHKVVARVLSSIEVAFDETNELSRFRPKLTQCMLTQMLPGPAASGVTVLVPRLLSMLKLTHLRNAVHTTLRSQVCCPTLMACLRSLRCMPLSVHLALLLTWPGN